jgi:HK97 family phage prohead protease
MASTDIEFKAMPGQFNIDEAQGMVECFVAGIGNKDSVGDVLISGAFAKSLQRRKPRVVWGHNWNDPIGKVLEIYEVAPGDRRLPSKMLNAGIGGLYARVQFNLNSEKGREAFANVAFFGQEQEWSIGYKTLDAIFDPNMQANVLKEVELYEVSPVLHGANQLTGTISVKSDDAVALADSEKGWGMMGPHHMMGQMPQKPNMIVIREDDDDKYESEKPIFAEGLAQPLGGDQRQRLEREISERTNSKIKLIEATESTAVFMKFSPNGAPTVYRIGYHTPDNYSTFMFGKPEVTNSGNSGSRTIVPSQMPSMPMQVKPGYEQGYGDIMPKSDEKSDLASQIEQLEDLIAEEIDEKVGKTINKRNLSKLKAILEGLQDVISSAEKEDLETKGYLIPLELEEAFSTKSLLDPIFDYHRVESIVTEDGILITSGVTKDLVEAIDNAQKGIGRSIGGSPGKVRAAGRAASANFDPKAWDGDGDGLVQEGTPFQRPAIPGVNDRATGGKVNARRAAMAFASQSGGSITPQPTSVSGDVVSKNDLPKAIVTDIENAARRAVDYRTGNETPIIEGAEEVLKSLTDEKLQESVGKSISNARRKLAEMLSDEKVIEEFSSRKAIDDFMDELGYAIDKMIDSHLNSVTKTGTELEKEEIDEIVDNAKSKFDDDFQKLIKASKEFWNTRRKPGRLDNTVEEAKKEAALDRNNLMTTLRDGGAPEDLESMLGSILGNYLFNDSREGIISGTISLEDLNYEIEKALNEIIDNDPSIDPKELVNEFGEALREGASKDGANPLIVAFAKEFGDEKITGGDLIDYLNDTRQSSRYRPDRGKIEKEKIRGFASTTQRTDREEDGADYDEAFGPRDRRTNRGMREDPVGEEVSDRIDRDSQNAAVRQGLASTSGSGNNRIVRPTGIQRDERGNVDATEARNMRAERDKAIFEKLREFGLSDQEIEELTGVPNGGRNVEQGDISQDELDELNTVINEGIAEGLESGEITGVVSREDARRILEENEGLARINPGIASSSKLPRKKITKDGALTPQKNLSITLDDDLVGLLNEEVDMLLDSTKNRQPLLGMKKILEESKNGKFEVTPKQFDDITAAIEDAFDNGVVTSDVYGVLHQAAESLDGKYDLNEINNPKKVKGFASSGRRVNNGAPTDMTELQQRQYVAWARQQRGLRVAQEIIQEHDSNNGQMPAPRWKALRTMYSNMGPGSAGPRRFASNTSQPTGGFRDAETFGPGPLPYVHTTTGWKKIGGAGGLNEAGKYMDPKTGKVYYVKHSRSGEEFRGETEILTSKLYQLLGVPTIDYNRGVHNGKLQRVSVWDDRIKEVSHSQMSRDPNFKASVQRSLIANAWLANWDGTGNMSNIVQGPNGEAVMADSGGGLIFRAQRYSGLKTNPPFGPKVDEVENLINGVTRSGQSVQTGVSRAYYKDIEPSEVARQVKELSQVTDDDIKKLVSQQISNPADGDRLAQLLIARRDWIVDHWSTGKMIDNPPDTSRSDASGARAKPFTSLSKKPSISASRVGFASGIDGPGDDERGGGASRARGVGEMVPGGNLAPGRARREGEKNRAGTEVGTETKFAGKTFDEVKPDNWEELTTDEKFQWALTQANPENGSGMSPVAYRKLLADLGDQMDKEELAAMTPAEKKAEQKRRRAEQREIENMGYMPENSEKLQPKKPRLTDDEDPDEVKPVKVKKSKNAEDAKTEREKRLDGLLEGIDNYRSKFDSDLSENDDHRDVWDKVSIAIQEGEYDFTIRSLDSAIEVLDEYIGEYEEGELTKAERLNISSAKAMRKQIAKARAGYVDDEWIPGQTRSKPKGDAISFTSATGGTSKKFSINLAKDIQQDLKKLNGTGKPGTRGFASTSSGGKTMITDEATFFKDVQSSLDKEIRRATKDGDKRAVAGLRKLSELISSDEAGKTGSRRTNVGSIYFTAEEADQMLDGLMFALDTQLADGGEKRIGWYSKLIEMIAGAAKSTFIDKKTNAITDRTRTGTNSRGQSRTINIVPEA